MSLLPAMLLSRNAGVKTLTINNDLIFDARAVVCRKQNTEHGLHFCVQLKIGEDYTRDHGIRTSTIFVSYETLFIIY